MCQISATDDTRLRQTLRKYRKMIRGLLLGVELVEDRQSKTLAHALRFEVSRRCMKLGGSMNIGRRSLANIFRIAPSLTVSREQIDTTVSIFDQALTECAG